MIWINENQSNNGSKVKCEQVPCGAGVLQYHLTKIHLKAKETSAWKNPFSHTTSNNVGCSTTLVVLDVLPWNGFHRLEIAKLGDHLTLHLAPLWGIQLWTGVKLLNCFWMDFHDIWYRYVTIGRNCKNFHLPLRKLNIQLFWIFNIWITNFCNE